MACFFDAMFSITGADSHSTNPNRNQLEKLWLIDMLFPRDAAAEALLRALSENIQANALARERKRINRGTSTTHHLT